jgi:maleamate amidohydrolase
MSEGKSLAESLDEMQQLFQGKRWGLPAGFGNKPAVLVVDAIRAFTDPAYPQALAVDAEISAIAQLLRSAHHQKIPIVFVTIGYHDPETELGSWLGKSPGLGDLREGDRAIEPDPRLGCEPGDLILLKKGSSAFFETSLANWLRERQVDTCIITGFTANGCVMATAIDARQYGFRTVIVEDAVASRLEFLKQVSLCNLRTWADIVSLSEAAAYLDSLGENADTARRTSPSQPAQG